VSEIFLDVNFFKGPSWQLTSFLDTFVFQKSVNMYLYTLPSSEHPRHCCFGLVFGEVTRYIRLSSSFASFVAITLAFHKRLRARGFLQDLLRQAFERVPTYDMRPEILAKILLHPRLPPFRLVIPMCLRWFSRQCFLVRASPWDSRGLYF
jgi:hypothetical protein